MNFVLYVILVNVLLFFPRYLIGLPKKWNPFRFLFSNDTFAHKVKSLYFSRIIDPFRLSFEYCILSVSIYFLELQGHTATILLSVVAVLIFVFNIYVAVFLGVLKKTPIFKSDLFFLRESISIYKGYFVVISMVVIGLFWLLFYSFYYLHLQLLTFNFTWFPAAVLLLFTLIGGLWNVKFYNVTDYLSRSVFSLLVFSQKSQKQSRLYEGFLDLTSDDIRAHNHFSKVNLKVKPNIHIISMESYGSVLLRDKDNYGDVKGLLEEWNAKFMNSEIRCCSTLAVPPLFATGTWYSYSTLLFGTTIDNGALQNILFSEMANFEEYQSLFQFTKSSGYTNYLLQGMIGEFEGTLDFQKLKKNLNYDHLIYNRDLEYQGQLLKFMNLQNCVPDQHTLNKGLELIRKSNDPYTMFCCTLNSHWDFYSPLQVVSDWKDLANVNTTFATTMDQNYSRQERYRHSIKYTINSVFETILNSMSSNDIFIVYGDHQPTTITDEKYGKETPMHIFSHNIDFIELWDKYGFQGGLVPEEGKQEFRFEAFYSAFMNCINEAYGHDPEMDLPFFNDGIKFR